MTIKSARGDLSTSSIVPDIHSCASDKSRCLLHFCSLPPFVTGVPGQLVLVLRDSNLEHEDTRRADQLNHFLLRTCQDLLDIHISLPGALASCPG